MGNDYVKWVSINDIVRYDWNISSPETWFRTCDFRQTEPFRRLPQQKRCIKLGEKPQKDIPLPAEGPHAPIATADVGRIQIVDIPLQAPEFVLAWLHQYVHLAPDLFVHPLQIAVHVPLRVARAQDGYLGLQQLRQSLLPLV